MPASNLPLFLESIAFPVDISRKGAQHTTQTLEDAFPIALSLSTFIV
jgi:hypothetical protein